MSLCVLFAIFATFADPQGASSAPTPAVSSSRASVSDLSFNDLIVSDGIGGLKPSEKALSLEGKHVRITGFMADLEEMPRGGFYLCPLPVHGDESGAGIGDIPPHAVAVLSTVAPKRQFLAQKGRVIVTGVFHVGAPQTADDFVGAFRITADPAPVAPPKATRAVVNTAKKTSSVRPR